MKAFVLIYILFLAFLVSCSEAKEKYKVFSEDLSYRYLQIGEEGGILDKSTILLNLCVTDQRGDTIHYVPDFPYLIQIKNHPLDSLWKSLSVGDSISVLMERSLLNSYIELYEPMKVDSGMIYLHARIIESIPSYRSQQRIKELLSFKEIKEQEKLNKFLKNYPDSLEYIDGVYRNVTVKTEGIPLHFGDQLTISYSGRFLNGYVFDSTIDKDLTPTFTYGKDLQLLEGIQKGLIGLKEGETVKIILPSRHAFGENGSLAGIVPPFTTVIFDINILKVSN